MIKTFLVSCALTCGLSITACAQADEKLDAQTAIDQLRFLVGYWAGDGTSYDLDTGTTKHYFDREHVRFDLDKNLLLINASGQLNGKTTYQLHTVIFYDVEAQHYVYTPYSGQRTPRPFTCELTEVQQFICLTAAKTYRLTFQRLPDKRWNEYGERLEDGVWRKTFETKLSPVPPN